MRVQVDSCFPCHFEFVEHGLGSALIRGTSEEYDWRINATLANKGWQAIPHRDLRGIDGGWDNRLDGNRRRLRRRGRFCFGCSLGSRIASLLALAKHGFDWRCSDFVRLIYRDLDSTFRGDLDGGLASAASPTPAWALRIPIFSGCLLRRLLPRPP